MGGTLSQGIRVTVPLRCSPPRFAPRWTLIQSTGDAMKIGIIDSGVVAQTLGTKLIGRGTT
jgi:hypothetical protein